LKGEKRQKDTYTHTYIYIYIQKHTSTYIIYTQHTYKKN
jgi:hypothetical protein